MCILCSRAICLTGVCLTGDHVIVFLTGSSIAEESRACDLV